MDNIEFKIVKDFIKTTYNRIRDYEHDKTEENEFHMNEAIACFISFVVANKETLIGKDK
jgi:hypothetical protein